MSISTVKIEGFKGLNISSELKRVNIVVGENDSGKTNLLESIFMSTLFQSDLNDNDINTSLLYTLNSRGDILSAFSSLSDSKVTLDNITTQFKKVDPYSLDVEINDEKVVEIRIKPVILSVEILSRPSLLPVAKIVKRTEFKYSPIYISTSFDNYGNPERIYSIAKKKNSQKIKCYLDILQDEFDQFKLHYGNNPAYTIGRGLLKRELITLGLISSNIIMIDEIENSLHPDLLMQVMNDIKDEKNTQVIFTTNSNEVIKIAKKVFNDEEAQVIYLSRGGYKAYEISEISEFEKPFNWLGFV